VNDNPLSSDYWRKRATEARKGAAEAGDLQTEATILSVARLYDEMAEGSVTK
jgi:hypothetical protein